MKPFEQQTYYELLEIPVTAPVDDIRAAYSRLMELYAPDSIAVYALVDPEQVDSLRARMTEAMEILTDADLRAEYDKDLGLPTQRMVEAVATGGTLASGATPEAGTVARAAEALASAAVGEGAEARQAPAPASPPPPAEPAATPVGPVDFRSTFVRGFSFAYVSSSLQDPRLMGSSVFVPTPTPATSSAPVEPPASAVARAEPVEPAPRAPAPASVPAEPVQATPSTPAAPAAVSVPTTVVAEPVQATPSTAPAIADTSVSTAVAAEPATADASVPATVAAEPVRAPEPTDPSLAIVPARPEGTPAPVSRPVPPPLTGARAAASGAAASGASSARSPEQGRQAPRPGSGRQLGDAQLLSQDAAIATAEAALAQVAARVREPRPRTPDIPADAEFNGELLRRVREARGQSLQQVADRTRITRSHLENVEADRYTALPAPVYLRGILMNLARELGLDPLRVSRSYLALASEKSGKK
jgi:hypothetical protein